MAETFEPGDIVEYAIDHPGIGIVLGYEGPEILHIAWIFKPSSRYWKTLFDGFLSPAEFTKIGHVEESM